MTQKNYDNAMKLTHSMAGTCATVAAEVTVRYLFGVLAVPKGGGNDDGVLENLALIIASVIKIAVNAGVSPEQLDERVGELMAESRVV
jgi:hypothetical protein